MTGTNLLFDTNIVIHLSKGDLDLKTITKKHNRIYISVITYMEALGYSFKDVKEKTLIENLLNSIEIIQTDLEIANTVIEIRKGKKIKTPDAIIFATAKRVNADLMTVNTTDFKGLDKSVKIINPFK